MSWEDTHCVVLERYVPLPSLPAVTGIRHYVRVVAPSERVRRKAEALFAGRAAEATDILSQLVWGQQSSERIHTAVLVVSDGEWSRFLEAAWLARMDWRDVLVGADLADEGWPDRVDAYLRRP